ncbi:site-2 protease family protein [Candidatus Peregrinibacteria bacterium]|jgi:Zn-dependent protease|nr:site-2 protease family protein [Candidatus Peregrinibacteria bacterium]
MIYSLILLALTLVTAITIHECAHAWTAFKLGDPTAKMQGRVSLNPLRHLDPLGTLMIFIAKIGWGKPVPVNPNNFKNPIRDNAIVAAAGPLSNLLTAFIVALPYQILLSINNPIATFLSSFLGYLIMISVVLCLFNLLPFRPLDGASILAFFIPRKHFFKFEKFMEDHTGHFMAFIIIDIFLLEPYLNFSFLKLLVFTPAQYIIHFIMAGI